MKPRLVHVTTTDMSLDWLLGPQLEAFAARGYEVIGVSAPGPHRDALAARGVEHIAVNSLTRAMSPRGDAAALIELYRLLRRLLPDIVHTHNPKPGVLGRVAARAAGVPAIVNTVHGLYAQPTDRWRRKAPVYALERIGAACSHIELLQNCEDLPVLRRLGVPEARLTVLGNGIDLARFDRTRVRAGARDELRASLGLAPDAVVCGLVGRLVWEKGYREVFAAARALRSLAPQLRIVVIGPRDPDKADAVDDAAMRRAEASGVVFTGEQRNIEEWYAAIDIYALASYREGFPRSAMEAAAMGLPVVVTDIRGGRQVVDHGRTGSIVPPRDWRALAHALAGLANRADDRRALGEAARRKAQCDFDQQRVIDITLDAYERVMPARFKRAAAQDRSRPLPSAALPHRH